MQSPVLELAAWCDLRVASEHAVLEVFCRRIGVPLVDLGTVRLPRLIGHSRAMDLTLTGRGIEATEAYAMDSSTASSLTQPRSQPRSNSPRRRWPNFPKSTVHFYAPEVTKHGKLFSSLVVHHQLKGKSKTFPFFWKGDPWF